MRQSTEKPARELSLMATLIALLLGICGANVAMCQAQQNGAAAWWVDAQQTEGSAPTLTLQVQDLQARFPDIFALNEADRSAPLAPCILPAHGTSLDVLVVAQPPAAQSALVSVPCGRGGRAAATVTVAVRIDPENRVSTIPREALHSVLMMPGCEGKARRVVTSPPSYWDVDEARVGFVHRAGGSRACQRQVNLHWCQRRNALCVDSCVASSACGVPPDMLSTHCARMVPPTGALEVERDSTNHRFGR